MNYTIEGTPLPVVLCHLDPGEVLISEAGGRTWMRGNVKTETIGGGAKKAIGRMFSGESMFLSRYTAEGPAEIAFASCFPGSIRAIELRAGESIICQKRAFLLGTAGIDLSIHFQKHVGKGLFGGEGFIMQRITGPGLVFLEIDGHCVEYDLAPGERLVCDTGVVAYMDSTCTLDVERIKGGKNIFFGGEGLFDTVITGPGKVSLQTMTAASLAGVLAPFLPSGS